MQVSRAKPVLDWEKNRPAIARHYHNENKPLREVMAIMSRDHSFFASPKQYKDQLKKWKLVKNLNMKDVALCLYAWDEIAKENRKQDILLRDRLITRADINTYLKKTKKTEAMVRAAMARPASWPAHITFRPSDSQLETPPSSRGQHGGSQAVSPSLFDLATPMWTMTSPLNVSSGPSRVLTPKSSLSQRTSVSSMHLEHPDGPTMAEDDGIAAEPQGVGPHDADDLMEDVDVHEDDVSADDMMRICDELAASNNFVAMVRQTVTPKPRGAAERADPRFFALLSKSATAVYQEEQTAEQAANSSTLVEPYRGAFPTTQSARLASDIAHASSSPTEPSVSFLRKCLSACIIQGEGFHEAAAGLMHNAVQIFKAMISQRDPYCLTALNLLTTVLESVGQRLLAETVLQRILEATHGHLQNDGPVKTTIRFMLEIVGRRAKESEYDAPTMFRVYHELCELWGENSPSALTGCYHVAWILALADETRAEAWSILDPLKARCEATLGDGHFLTITTMMTSARVLYHLGGHWQAASMINQAIKRLDLMYEDFHPVCLEARSRQAMLLMKLEGSHDIETILRDVLAQQVAILGVENPRTQSTLATFQNFLKTRNQILSLPEILTRIGE